MLILSYFTPSNRVKLYFQTHKLVQIIYERIQVTEKCQISNVNSPSFAALPVWAMWFNVTHIPYLARILSKQRRCRRSWKKPGHR